MKSVIFCCMLIDICLLCFPYLISCRNDDQYEICKKVRYCGNQTIQFPFYTEESTKQCGFPGFQLSCINNYLLLNISQGSQYRISKIFYENNTLHAANVFGLRSGFCNLSNIRDLLLPSNGPFEIYNNSSVLLLSNCDQKSAQNYSKYKVSCGLTNNDEENLVLAMNKNDLEVSSASKACPNVVVVPVGNYSKDNNNDYLKLMRSGFDLRWAAPSCSDCQHSGGFCGYEGDPVDAFKCFCSDRPHSRSCKNKSETRKAVIIGTAVPGACIMLFLAVLLILWKRKKLQRHFLKKDVSSDIEYGSSYFGVPVFSYKELEEATHNFHPSRELGDGGFGTVYYGKLRDGRDVAVKRCYENNYRRVEQFMNEIHILTLLRHRNLVLLYGSTSKRSRDLLLVYEYIPNGTLADHIHGDKSKTEPLTWPIRMNIAVETASALSYLHKSDIIHRDVKTNNILLDNNFCVKVADFGLSRLFPTDVTHVSTAPQGTPGYVDPEYYQCYQLTDKSDVYSFGVVLVELISSLPAVDMNRQRNEINLGNLAIDRIQRCVLHELIDPVLGNEDSTTRMTTSVAELAFRCLQLDKDLRPTMDEVLVCLEQIQGVDQPKRAVPQSPEMEDVVLLKKNSKLMDSPVGVIDRWISTSTTPTSSG